MRFHAAAVAGAWVIDLEEKRDSRGFFARAFSQDAFAQRGLAGVFVQCNLSFNIAPGILRGMHYQTAPSLEAKLVRCIQGSIYDVILDLRPESATFLKHFAVELSAVNRRSLYVPPMCAHGYQTLEPNSEVLYLTSGHYNPACERGVRYDDPAFRIAWPLPVLDISAKDASWPLFSAAVAGDRE